MQSHRVLAAKEALKGKTNQALTESPEDKSPRARLGRGATLSQDGHILGRWAEDTAAFAGILITPEAQRSQPHFQTQSWYQSLLLGPHLTSVLPLLPAFSPECTYQLLSRPWLPLLPFFILLTGFQASLSRIQGAMPVSCGPPSKKS